MIVILVITSISKAFAKKTLGRWRIALNILIVLNVINTLAQVVPMALNFSSSKEHALYPRQIALLTASHVRMINVFNVLLDLLTGKNYLIVLVALKAILRILMESVQNLLTRALHFLIVSNVFQNIVSHVKSAFKTVLEKNNDSTKIIP